CDRHMQMSCRAMDLCKADDEQGRTGRYVARHRGNDLIDITGSSADEGDRTMVEKTLIRNGFRGVGSVARDPACRIGSTKCGSRASSRDTFAVRLQRVSERAEMSVVGATQVPLVKVGEACDGGAGAIG